MMHFLIAHTFTDSLAKLTNEEQKAVKTTAFDLQANPSRPGLKFHKLDRARDRNFWSVRVSRDIRIIVHRTGNSLMLCYVDHHDKAYQWAERRRLETHPRTGAAQFIEIRERVQEISVPTYAPVEQEAPAKPLLFNEMAEGDLLNYGVPPHFIEEVQNANEDSFLDLVEYLPEEAAETLFIVASGGTPRITPPITAANPFDHPDAQRRFRLMTNVEELERALEFPWEKWAIFLHPAQRRIVEKNYNGPARVSGSAGTGKTVVAMHRAVFLARTNPDARVLLTTFSDTLANALRTKLGRLIHNEPRVAERVEVNAIDMVGERLYEAQFGALKIASREIIQECLANAADQLQIHTFSPRFLIGEWENVVDAWQLDTWEAYRDVRRLGRRTRLPVTQREKLWSIFERVHVELENRGLLTRASMFGLLTENLRHRRNPPFDFAIVDEAQDISVAQLRFLAALGGQQPNSLFFAGDSGQRIFRTPFSWKALGVDIRGRSHMLKLNYRTSHQIRMQADRLLNPEISDVDGNVEDRRGTVSAFNGPPPTIRTVKTESEEIELVGTWLQERRNEGIRNSEIGIFVRSAKELGRARKAANAAEFPFHILDERRVTSTDKVSIGTMHLTKGLEFCAVAVMACDDEIIPLQQRIETVVDDAYLADVYDTERHLLYVACTRARDRLLITGVDPASEFLDDLVK